MKTWQELMDESYAIWQNDGYEDYDDMLEKVSEPNRIAILLGNLNYQVENGGWSQWVTNGYGLYAQDVLDILKKMNTPKALEVCKMIDSFADQIDYDLPNTGWSNYWLECKCDNCNGTGSEEVECYNCNDDDEETCPECNGDGSIDETCPECEGSGVLCEDYIESNLDTKYYAINDEFQAEVDEYLKKMQYNPSEAEIQAALDFGKTADQHLKF